MQFDLDHLLQPNRPEDMDVQPLELGAHRYPALVVDGFYRDPAQLRRFAMALHYKAPAGMHPGYAAVASLRLDAIVPFLFEHLGHWYFASPAAMEKEANPIHFFRMERRPNDPPRPLPQRPHADPGLLAAIVYLNEPAQCQGGTSFFRHEESGAEALFPKELIAGRCPDTRSSAWKPDTATVDRLWRHGAGDCYERARDAKRYAGYDEYWAHLNRTPGSEDGPIVGSCGGWTLTRTVEMKFNRLLLFPAFMLHSGHFRPEWFGDAPEACRLTQNIVFNWPAGVRP